MRLPRLLFSLLILTSPSLSVSSKPSPPAETHTSTIYYIPLSTPSASPLPLAIITYSPTQLTGRVQSYTPPDLPSSFSSSSSNNPPTALSPTTHVRIGLLNSSSNNPPTLSTPNTLVSIPGLHDKTAGLKDEKSPRTDQGTFLINLHPSDTSSSSSSSSSSSIFSISYHPNDPKHTLPEGITHVEGEGEDAERGEVVPHVVVVQAVQAPVPVLNRPVELTAEGKVPEKEAEKSFMQKYWWVFLGAAVLAMAGGGGDK